MMDYCIFMILKNYIFIYSDVTNRRIIAFKHFMFQLIKKM